MRIQCKDCGYKARISHSVPMGENPGDIRDLYCQCMDVECGHTFVMKLAFSHTINPPAQSHEQMLLQRLRRLPPAEQQRLFDEASKALSL
ncbi:ogr/Delta-like zinc finger family protein [uncultured Amphritea sp.]|uniref:ogr/Delta-like zinc finger family protein n=1 Tax=uncultured Amphritea sp. TaxID=981605 RepID=UPI0025DC92FA|nr:ogr/Delta-like zinc finger family protein [uncultured Amphritea sp.]